VYSFFLGSTHKDEMTVLQRMKTLPICLQRYIYSFDETYRVLFSNTVLVQLIHYNLMLIKSRRMISKREWRIDIRRSTRDSNVGIDKLLEQVRLVLPYVRDVYVPYTRYLNGNLFHNLDLLDYCCDIGQCELSWKQFPKIAYGLVQLVLILSKFEYKQVTRLCYTKLYFRVCKREQNPSAYTFYQAHETLSPKKRLKIWNTWYRPVLLQVYREPLFDV